MASTKAKTPVQAIREFCKQCAGGSMEWIRTCNPVEPCPLHPFRMGKNPNVSDKVRANAKALAERLKLEKK